MPLFACEQCGCVENTALSPFWIKDDEDWPEDVRGKALCSECAPTHYLDGSETGYGKWHGEFEKTTPEDRGYVVGVRGFLEPPGGWG
jgi:hypothetical protein